MSTQVYPDPKRIQHRPPPRCADDLAFWGVWKYEPGSDGKPTKVCYNPKTGYRAKSNTPTTFGTRAQAERALASGNYTGLCYLVDASVGITAGDLDHVVSEEDAFNEDALPPAIRRIIRIANTDTTWSPSGTGIHLIFGTTVNGYESRNGGRAICHAEAYNRVRYMTHTDRRISGTPVTFNDDADDLTAWYEALGFRKREAEQPTQPQPERTPPSLATEEIITRASNAANGAKFRELYDGGLCGKQSRSEARYALIGMFPFWTQDPGQIEDALRSSGQWNAKVEKRPELVRKEIRDQLQKYRGPVYGDGQRPVVTSSWHHPPESSAGATCDEQLVATRAELAEARQSIIVLQDRVRVADERRIAAEERAERLSFERSKIMEILRNPNLGTGEKLTHFATVIDLGARIANGEEQAPQGFRLPAVRIAEQTGQSPQTVRKHWKAFNRRGVITKINVRESTERDGVDPETGEIVTATGTREVTHIVVPENNIIHLIQPAATYERQEDDKPHGGTRTPKPACALHPEAGTLTRTVIECAECHQELSRSTGTYEAPAESSGINLIGEPPVTNTVLRDTKLIGEPPLDDDPPDYWMPPNWEDERRRVYGDLYRGEVAS